MADAHGLLGSNYTYTCNMQVMHIRILLVNMLWVTFYFVYSWSIIHCSYSYVQLDLCLRYVCKPKFMLTLGRSLINNFDVLYTYLATDLTSRA